MFCSERVLLEILPFLLLFPVVAAYGQPASYFVDDDAASDPGPGDPTVSDPGEDGSADHPFDAIQEGIDAASPGDVVVVLDGTYTGVGNRDLDFGGKAIALRSQNGPDNCVIDCQEAGRGFYFHSGETADSIVDGLSVINGNAYASGTERPFGGGLYIGNSSPTIRNCTITDNTWEEYGGPEEGGGMYCFESSVTIENCLIGGNSADYGGGINCRGGTPTIENCLIAGNSADQGGGGINCRGGTPTIVNCVITGNHADDVPGLRGNGASPTIIGCTISDNEDTGFGCSAGLWCHWGTVVIADCLITRNVGHLSLYGAVSCSGDVTITNCRIVDNFSGEGQGGAVHSSGNVAITNCTATGNTAGDGGAIYHSGGTLTLVNCILARNAGWGGPELPGDGGGVWFRGDNLTMTNCTIVDNYADGTGASVYCADANDVTIANCILWGEPLAEISENAVVTYSDVQGGWTGDGNIDSDPLFVDPNNSDYHLSADSPCVNAGANYVPDLPPADFEDHERIRRCRVDMGADESPHVPPLTDCNDNGRDDDCDIHRGRSADTDQNHIPDECESGPDDATDDGDHQGPGEALLPPCCGARPCGPGVVGWMPLTIFGLCCLKARRRCAPVAHRQHRHPRP